MSEVPAPAKKLLSPSDGPLRTVQFYFSKYFCDTYNFEDI